MTSVCNESKVIFPREKHINLITSFKKLYDHQLTMDSDSDYDDVGFIPDDRNVNTVNDNNVRKPPKTNDGGKTTRGGDSLVGAEEI